MKAKELKGNKQDRNQPQTSPAHPSQQSDSATQQDSRTHRPVGGGDSIPPQYRRNNQQTNTPQPARSNNVDPYQAKPVDPYKANDITPERSQPVTPVHSTPVQPVQGTDLQGNVPNGPGSGRTDQRGNIEWRDRNGRGRDDDRNHDRGERERAYQLERQRREEAERGQRERHGQQRREAYERERREAYERERREAYERDRREHDHHKVSDRNSDRSWHGRGEEHRREYFISHDGQRIYVERDHSGRCTRRYIIADGKAFDVDSRGRRIFAERDRVGVERHYVLDGNRNRYEYVIDDTGRETLVQRDTWGRIKNREFYAEQPRGTIETYRADDVQAYQAEGIEPYRAEEIQPYQAQEVQPYQSQEVRPYNAQDVTPLTSDELKEMLAQDPALKKQMQDYAADLQKRGMAREDVLKAVYRRLNEIHAQRARSNSQNIEPYRAPHEPKPPREVGPDPNRYPRKQEPARSGSNSPLFHTFGLAVPGVAYSFDNYATNTRTNVVAAGALTKSSIRVSPDHTYIWNSAWDGKTIRGQWKEWKDGGVLIMHGQEGKDWLLQTLPSASGKATVVLYNDMTQYHGTPLD